MRTAPAIGVTTPLFSKINPAGVAVVCFTNCAGKSFFRLRYGNQVNMIGHQALCPDFYIKFSTLLRHKFQIGLIVIVTEKGLLTAVAPLGDVVRDVGGYNSCNACHIKA